MNEISPDDLDDVTELSKQIEDNVNAILDSNSMRVAEAALVLAIANLLTPPCCMHEENIFRYMNSISTLVARNIGKLENE